MEGTSDAAAATMRTGVPHSVPGVDQLPAAVHGLFWMTANLARRGPLAIGVDDAQWADDAGRSDGAGSTTSRGGSTACRS